MQQITSLTGSHLRTYKTIFQHPVSHNLGWHEVHALFRNFGGIEEEPNGNFKVTRNGRTLVLKPPRTKDVETSDEVLVLRHFIEQSNTTLSKPYADEARWLVVIDHHEARIYRSPEAGSIAQQIRSRVPEDFSRHPHNANEGSRGLEKPHANSYFEPVAALLNGAGQILVLGAGTGTSNEMDQFVVWLKHRHPEVARRIVGTVVIDKQHMTDAQLLEKARDFYATSKASGA